MQITGTCFNYYHVCERKLWFHAKGIRMEHTSDLVYEGRLIHEGSYPQRSTRYREVELSGGKVDFYDPKAKVIHEVKKSDKVEPAHLWQLKYYIYLFEENGIEGVSGVLEYPVLRKKVEVEFQSEDRREIEKILAEIEKIISDENCPPLVKKRLCGSCSYYEFCFAQEMEEEK